MSVREVAQEAGVSASTVSRVFSGDYPVSPATRERVLAAAERVGHRPNALARNFRHGRTSTVGVCSVGLSTLAVMSTIEGISETLGGFGRQVQVAMSQWEVTRERAAITSFLEERVAGVLSFPTQEETASYLQLQDAGIPLVLINRTVPGVPAPVVRHDFAGGYRLAVENLAGAGHRRMAAILPSRETSEGDRELRREHRIAWSAAMERLGLDSIPEWQLPGGEALDVPRLESELADLFSGGASERPTALFCGLVPATLAALRVFDELGIRVPQDVTMLGTADPRWRHLIPSHIPLVILDSFELGTKAAELLEDAISSDRVTSDAEVVVGVTLDVQSWNA